jgi:hypothetical protein
MKRSMNLATTPGRLDSQAY